MCREAIRIKRPRYCILENVENLVSEKFYPLFSQWEQVLAGMGYNNYWKVVNALECGVPQNRKRVFLVSILDQEQYFEFPKPMGKVQDLDQILEADEDVDEKYFVTREKIKLIDGDFETADSGQDRGERTEAIPGIGHSTLFAEGGLLL